MKAIQISILSLIGFFIFAKSSNAQAVNFNIGGHYSNVVTDFADKDITNPDAAFLYYSSGSRFEIIFYSKKNWGFGFRFGSTTYQRDQSTYDIDLKNALGIKTDYFYYSSDNAYRAYGTDLGFSYLFKFKDDLALEPYFYLGFRQMKSPSESGVFYQNSKSYSYRKNAGNYTGYAFMPGLRLYWMTVADIIKFNLYLEYEAVSYNTETEQSVFYSADTYKTTSVNRNLNPNAINFGLGISFFFEGDDKGE